MTSTGGHLAFGAPVGRRSDQCWSENRALRRTSTTRRGNGWVTRCKTQDEDARAEQGTYTLEATNVNLLERRGTSRYNWQLNESTCVATVTESQRFERSAAAPIVPAEVDTPRPSCTLGTPVGLRVRPEARRIEPGQQACFRASLVDGAGCTGDVRAEWSLERPPGLGGQLRGRCFRAAGSAASAEGTFRVFASAQGFRASGTVVVQTADLSDLRAQRIAEGKGGSRGDSAARAEEAARLAASSQSDGGSPLLIGAMILLGLGLIGIGVFAVMTRRRLMPAAPGTAPPPGPAPGPGPGPVPARSVPAGPATDPSPPPRMSMPPSVSNLICPVCRRGYAQGTNRCPRDDAALLPYDVFVAQHKEGAIGGSTDDTRRVCPTCGTEYQGETRFCGKDGTALQVVK